MKIKPRTILGPLLASALVILCLSAQPAFGLSCPTQGCTLQQKLAVDGSNVCLGLDTLPSVTLPTDQIPPAPASVTVTGSEAEHVCKRLQSDLFYNANPTTGAVAWPSLWELSQIIAATIDVPYAKVASTLRATYASDLLSALEQYPDGWPALSCSPALNTGGYQADPRFCGGLSATTAGTASGGSEYYDDNAWVGSDLAQAYNWSCGTPAPTFANCNRELVDAALGLYSFESSGIQSTSNSAFNGIRFSINDTGYGANRPAVVNADAANFPADLWTVDKAAYKALDSANTAYQWVRNTLELPGPNAGVFYNDINSSNVKEGAPNQSYADGLMIGTAWKLAVAAQSGAITQAGYYNQAKNYAQEANAHFVNNYGTPGHNGFSEGWSQNPTTGAYSLDLEAECPAYDAVYFHALWPLDNANVYSTKTLLGGYVYWIQKATSDGQTFPWPFVGNSSGCSNPSSQDYILPEAGVAYVLTDALAAG